ncbi:tRNA 5-methylaminomethyl-2-thiouridine biosynthesis bifunctional MnmC [Gossypium arboreum]|uniref:tRNA 5-methylaminomethyl-2-thiouridine biosynthesis bifunctional MnmC n=1 Tax=Gossypium arboreum TaxID=29729 RepID=A0A0B0P3I5_GOSAR|nr:tRNA 5-methylaminomethyl-2-thiouridine biosynthesis bifunctional MnmC [Gossypium arboreum]
MQNTVAKVAVVGSGISGSVCAATLARNGISVTLFDSARGPGGRMSQRREISEDGRELLFDHGAPYFTVTNPDVLSVVTEWESRGLVAEWKSNFGSFDCFTNKFVNTEHQERESKKYVGVPGMNSICKALCHEPGVDSKFNMGIGKFEWLEHENLWSLIGLDGQHLGHFKGVVASDKNIASPRFTAITGQPPPLDIITKVIQELSNNCGYHKSQLYLAGDLSLAPELVKLHDIPIYPCFALMLAFNEPLYLQMGCRSPILSERWVLHSTTEYAKDVIAQSGLEKPSKETLSKVGNEMLQEFLGTGLTIPQPFFMKAHRWGSAFPATSIAKEEKCVWSEKKKLAICGDFCLSPNVEGAILSGLAAASKLKALIGTL